MRKKKGSYSDIFKGVEGKLFCSKFKLEFGHQFFREIALEKYFSLGGKKKGC
jgi:hypothetical protein